MLEANRDDSNHVELPKGPITLGWIKTRMLDLRKEIADMHWDRAVSAATRRAWRNDWRNTQSMTPPTILLPTLDRVSLLSLRPSPDGWASNEDEQTEERNGRRCEDPGRFDRAGGDHQHFGFFVLIQSRSPGRFATVQALRDHTLEAELVGEAWPFFAAGLFEPIRIAR